MLIYDLIQESSAPGQIKSAALADRFYGQSFNAVFPLPSLIDCIGIGGTDAKRISLYFSLFDGWNLNGGNPSQAGEIDIDGGNPYNKPDDFRYDLLPDWTFNNIHASCNLDFDGSGLYRIPTTAAASVTVTHDGSYMGRFAAGHGVNLPTSLAKEPSFNTTNQTVKTISGQALPGIGGYNYRGVSLDTRYKIGGDAMHEIKLAWPLQISKGFPFFLLFDSELKRLPFYRFYAQDDSTEKFGFESGAHDRYLFSRKFNFIECF
jgi:hypothetical protein